MSACLRACLSGCMSACMPAGLPGFLPALYAFLNACLSVVCLYACGSVCSSTCLVSFFYLLVCLYVCFTPLGPSASLPALSVSSSALSSVPRLLANMTVLFYVSTEYASSFDLSPSKLTRSASLTGVSCLLKKLFLPVPPT
jgi:hypothetical protein